MSNYPKLLISCAKSSQFPESRQFECVLVGKSNVGKSSLINGISQRKNLAFVGKTPGKTRLANFYEISEDLMLVDVPGYGFARRSKQEAIAYGELMEDYFRDRTQLKAMIVVVDIRRGLSEDDLMMIDLAKQKKLALCLALSKQDKVNQSQLVLTKRKLQEQLAIPIYSFSALKPQSFKAISQQIQQWIHPL